MSPPTRVPLHPSPARTLLLAAVALASLPPHAPAQVPGLPLFHEPFRAPPGIDHGVLLTLGHARQEGGGHQGALSWTLGGRYRPADRLTVQAAGGVHYPVDARGERSARAQLGGAIDLLLVRRTVTVGLVTGAGYGAAGEGGVLTVPLGLGATWSIAVTETGAGPKIGLWAMPRGELVRRARDGASETDLGWGASWGVSAVTGAALGFNAGVDYRDVPTPEAGGPSLPPLAEWSFALLVRLWR